VLKLRVTRRVGARILVITMTSRAPVNALQYVVGLLMFVDSLQTDADQREYHFIQ